METVQPVSNSIQFIGCNDRRLERFENLFPLPNGMSYNSFFIDDTKTAILDTVDSSVTLQYLENVKYVLKGRDLDYLIINHMEPDHCANIVELAKLYPNIKVVGNATTFEFFEHFYPNFDLKPNYYLVKNKDELSLGQHTLQFVFAPMVHWPEVMFTYEQSEKILFSADAFGTFGAMNGNLFTDEMDYEDYYGDACRRYYANIVGKYGKQTTRAMKQVAKLDVAMIAPLHGPIWRSNLNYILDRYQKWASYTPEKPGVVIPYGSAYGNTASAVDYLAAELSKRGVEDIRIYDVAKTHPSYIIADIFKYSHVVFASITYNSAIFPAMQSFLDEMAQLMIKNRQYALIGNGSWSPMSSKLMGEFMANQSGWTNLADTITLRTTMAEDQKVTLNALADTIAQSIKAETVTN